jgi:hypothetical protein
VVYPSVCGLSFCAGGSFLDGRLSSNDRTPHRAVLTPLLKRLRLLTQHIMGMVKEQEVQKSELPDVFADEGKASCLEGCAVFSPTNHNMVIFTF